MKAQTASHYHSTQTTFLAHFSHGSRFKNASFYNTLIVSQVAALRTEISNNDYR